MLLTVRNKFLLRYTWGKLGSYPTYVTASHKLWLRWFIINLVRKGRRKNVMVNNVQLVEAHEELDKEIPEAIKATGPEDIAEKVFVQDAEHTAGEPVTETVH